MKRASPNVPYVGDDLPYGRRIVAILPNGSGVRVQYREDLKCRETAVSFASLIEPKETQ